MATMSAMERALLLARLTGQILTGIHSCQMRLRLALLLVALFAQHEVAQASRPAAAADHHFHSRALQREMPYRVLLPAGYDTSARRYPVLYLLHGLDGRYTDWTERTREGAVHCATASAVTALLDYTTDRAGAPVNLCH